MRALSLTCLVVLPLFTACHESPVSPEGTQSSAYDVAGLTAVMGLSAAVSHNCAGEPGTVLEAVTPVTPTVFWAAEIELISSQCRTTPQGRGLFTATGRILSDIPLPSTAIAVDLADANGVPLDFEIIVGGAVVYTGSFPCGDPSGSHGITYDCRISTTPGGIHHVEARFDQIP